MNMILTGDARKVQDFRGFINRPKKIKVSDDLEGRAREVETVVVAREVGAQIFSETYLVHPDGVAARRDLIREQAERIGHSPESLLALGSITGGRRGNYTVTDRISHYVLRVKGEVHIGDRNYGLLTSAHRY